MMTRRRVPTRASERASTGRRAHWLTAALTVVAAVTIGAVTPGAGRAETEVRYTNMITAYEEGDLVRARELAGEWLATFTGEYAESEQDADREGALVRLMSTVRSIHEAELALDPAERLAIDADVMTATRAAMTLTQSALATLDDEKTSQKAWLQRELGWTAVSVIRAQNGLAPRAALDEIAGSFADEMQLVGFDGVDAALAPPPAVDEGRILELDGPERAALRAVLEDYVRGLYMGRAELVTATTSAGSPEVVRLITTVQAEQRARGIRSVQSVDLAPPDVSPLLLRRTATDRSIYVVGLRDVAVRVERTDGGTESLEWVDMVRVRRDEAGRWQVVLPDVDAIGSPDDTGASGGLHRRLAYTVTGQVRTPLTGGSATANDQPVQYIRVIVMDEEAGADEELARGYTTSAGSFSIAAEDTSEAADLYVDIEYVGDAVDGQEVEVRASDGNADPDKDTMVNGSVLTDQPAGTVALDTLRTSTHRSTVVSHGTRAFKYLDGQYSGYTLGENPRYEATSGTGGSYVTSDGGYLRISRDDWRDPGSGNAQYSDIHHETWHWLSYRTYGSRWPDYGCSCNPHYANKECCEGFAMQEGSAQYFGNISAIAMFGGDGKTNLPGVDTWRGEDDTGDDNSGEIVEGTFTRGLRNHGEHPGVLEAFCSKAPDNWEELYQAYGDVKGKTSSDMSDLLDEMALNGIVYTRGKINKFLPEDDPPDMGPPADGNVKEIRDVVFVRGEIEPEIEALAKADLNIAPNANVVDPDQKDIGYKTAASGTGEDNPLPSLTFVGAVGWASMLMWDTTTAADGEYDVVVKTRMKDYQWEDTLEPDFTGDATATVNTNEKWLKTLQTWFNQDDTPTDDKEGKVIIDNAGPEVENFKPEP